MVKRCPGCDKDFDARSARGTVCSERCRNRVKRAAAKAERPDASEAAGVDLDVGVLVATARELARVGRLDSPKGRIALSLAARLDRSLVDTGSSYAAVARELSATLDAVMAGAPAEASDEVDELRLRRERRMQSA